MWHKLFQAEPKSETETGRARYRRATGTRDQSAQGHTSEDQAALSERDTHSCFSNRMCWGSLRKRGPWTRHPDHGAGVP